MQVMYNRNGTQVAAEKWPGERLWFIVVSDSRGRRYVKEVTEEEAKRFAASDAADAPRMVPA